MWGWADVGEKVTILQGDKRLAETLGAGKGQAWRVELPAQQPGKIADIVVAASNTISLTNILAGEVWLCSGQSNMQMPLQKGPWSWYGGVVDAETTIREAGADAGIRFFRERTGYSGKPSQRPAGEWVVASSEIAPQLPAVPYFFARHLRSALGAPVGVIVSTFGGTILECWVPPRKLEEDTAHKQARTKADATVAELRPISKADEEAVSEWKKQSQAAPNGGGQPPKPTPQLVGGQRVALEEALALTRSGLLYNGKIHSLAPFTIKGVLWYQGESNAGRSIGYSPLLQSLIEGWREDWGNAELPFIIVCLAGWAGSQGSTGDALDFAFLREAQIATAQRVDHVGIVSAVDLGDRKDLHPPDKKPVGQRAGSWALANVYGRGGISGGPVFGDVAFLQGKALVPVIANADGLVLRGNSGFELGDSAGKFASATAKLTGNRIEVVAQDIAAPVALRYAFRNDPECTVYNAAGLPALPFRTDKEQPTAGQ